MRIALLKFPTLILLSILMNSQIITGQIVNIPDQNFKTALLNHNPVIDTNNDGEIQVSEALATTHITAVAANIVSLVGVEEFSNLEQLFCFNNPITSVNLLNNTELKLINFTFANLTEIDLSANTQLLSVSLSNTSISAIDVTQLPDLELLNLGATNISSINLINNPDLLSLTISFTNVSTLDLSNNTAIEQLGIRDTGITSLDFSGLPNLKMVNLSDTYFTEADFSNNQQLCSLSARDCPLLNYINLTNGNNQALAQNQNCSIVFSIGSSSSTSGIYAHTGNANLDYICVDNVQFANDNFNLVPNHTQFVEDCSFLSVNSFSTDAIVFLSNPVKSNLMLSSKHEIKTIKIYAISGKELMFREINDKELNINIENMAPGVYFVALTTDGGNSDVLKFLKV